MYTLFGSDGSGSAAVEVALDVVGVPYRIVRASSWEPDSAIARLEKLNPLKQIPTLRLPDGSVLTESAAILIHLGLEFPSTGILPSDPVKRAQSIRGLVFVAANCYAAVGVIDHPGRWCTRADEATKDRIRRAARKRLHRNWEIFADVFRSKPFLCGAAPGGLDFLAAVVSKWAGSRAHLRKARPALLATLQRIESHPTVAPVFSRHWHD